MPLPDVDEVARYRSLVGIRGLAKPDSATASRTRATVESVGTDFATGASAATVSTKVCRSAQGSTGALKHSEMRTA